jgi:hypothetical protein
MHSSSEHLAGGVRDLLQCLRRLGAAMPVRLARPMSDTESMTTEQAATLRRLAEAAYELEAYKPNLTRAEADRRIAALIAKLKLLDGPPHTL